MLGLPIHDGATSRFDDVCLGSIEQPLDQSVPGRRETQHEKDPL